MRFGDYDALGPEGPLDPRAVKFQKPIRYIIRAALFGFLLTVLFILYGIAQTGLIGGAYSDCLVSDKTASSESSSPNKVVMYRVQTSNCGNFNVLGDDNKKRWSSIIVGKSYDFKTLGLQQEAVGFRPNIVSATAS